MFSITEQLSAATKSQLEAQLNILNTFAHTAFEGAQQVIALNLHTTKESVEKGSAVARQLLEAKDAREFFTLSTVRPASIEVEGALAYGRALVDIASKSQSELLQAAKAQLKEAKAVVSRAPALAAPAAAPVAAAAKAAVAAAPTVAREVAHAAVHAAAAANDSVKAAPVAVEAAPAVTDPVEAPHAAPKAAAKAEAKAKPATPPKPVAEAVGSTPPKAAASFPDPKTNGTTKQLDMLAPGKGKK
jgi:phasin family protein